MSSQSSMHPEGPEVGTRTHKRPQNKPFEVWHRSAKGGLFREWSRMNKYVDKETAEDVCVQMKRKFPAWEYEVRVNGRV